MLQKFTDRAKKLIQAATNEARSLGSHNVLPYHLFMALLTNDGLAYRILKEKNYLFDLGYRLSQPPLVKQDVDPSNKIEIGAEVTSILEDADKISKNLMHEYVGTEHIFLGLLSYFRSLIVKSVPYFCVEVFKSAGINISALYDEIVSIINNPTESASLYQKVTPQDAVLERWKYKIDEAYYTNNEVFMDYLNSMGQSGWEVVDTKIDTSLSKDMKFSTRILFKKKC